MKLFLIDLILSDNKKKRYPCIADTEKEAKDLVLHYFDVKYRQVINRPSVKLVKLKAVYKIKRGVVR